MKVFQFFPICWQTANQALIPRSVPTFIFLDQYRSISETSILSELFEGLLAKSLSLFIFNEVLSFHQFSFLVIPPQPKLMIFYMTWTVSMKLVISLNFSSAFDTTDHTAQIFKTKKKKDDRIWWAKSIDFI